MVMAASLWVPSPASGQDDALPEHTLSDFTLGKVVSGELKDLKGLEGKVVAVEWWGTR
ncbi:hypothetical protein BH23VER1_BH23VER1_11210 [soil metagenome]